MPREGDLVALSQADMYRRVRNIKDEMVRRGKTPVLTLRQRTMLRQQAKETLLESWEEYLDDPQLESGRRVREAIQPVLREWADRWGRGITYHAAQVLTGDGCFGEYLCRIGKKRTTECHHCPEGADTAQHTLEFCPAWDEQRRTLRENVGQDLSLPAIIAAAVEPKEGEAK
ncbi:uncharacterized protein [Temnothorax longispinosus]|uniref:uncharacterized protein n=1 Tax=Temnothorax longispinosus TaxID=300112 RepID=UPI003A9A3F66